MDLIENILKICAPADPDGARKKLIELFEMEARIQTLASMIDPAPKPAGETIPNADVVFLPVGRYTSELTGEKFIAYDMSTIAERDNIDARNKAYANSLNKSIAEERAALNTHTQGEIARALGIKP